MKRFGNKRSILGEGPLWNVREQKLYYVNPHASEICILDPKTGFEQTLCPPQSASAVAFTREGGLIAVTDHGPCHLENGKLTPLFDMEKYPIDHCNDAKVGPDGRLYFGTQSTKRLGLSDSVDGKLYWVDRAGNVRQLLDGLLLSNGMDWSPDGKRFYHTDSSTRLIREYAFDDGQIRFTGRQVSVPGVDGFTVDEAGVLYVACWGYSQLAVIDPKTFTVAGAIALPVRIPASCNFGGEDMRTLFAVTVAGKYDDAPGAGYVYGTQMPTKGIPPYLF